MEHNYEKQIKCPYCDWEDSDSGEFDKDEGTATCGGCEREFNVQREIEVTYSTSRIACEDGKHSYKLESRFKRKKGFDEHGIWIDLPEAEWTYIFQFFCAECGDKEYITITKDEYYDAIRSKL